MKIILLLEGEETLYTANHSYASFQLGDHAHIVIHENGTIRKDRNANANVTVLRLAAQIVENLYDLVNAK